MRENIVRLRSKVASAHPHQSLYWVWGYLNNGKRFIMGGFESEMEAEQSVAQKEGVVNYDIRYLATTDISKAVRLCKAQDVNRLDNVEQALARVDRTGNKNG